MRRPSSSRDKDKRGRKKGKGPKKARRPFIKKVCRFCTSEGKASADYKDTLFLRKFITDRGKMIPRRITGNCAKHQRVVAREIRKSRIIGLLPFVAD